MTVYVIMNTVSGMYYRGDGMYTYDLLNAKIYRDTFLAEIPLSHDEVLLELQITIEVV